jgi:hypothetical protein
MVAVSLPGKYLPPIRLLDTCNICLLGRLAALLGRVNQRVSVRIHQPTRNKVTPEPIIPKFGFNTIFTIFGPKHYFFLPKVLLRVKRRNYRNQTSIYYFITFKWLKLMLNSSSAKSLENMSSSVPRATNE